MSAKQIWMYDPESPLERLAPVSCFKRKFSTSAGKLRLQLSALGLYHVRLDGKEITDNCFTPGWCDYRFRAEYNTYSIDINAGDHEIELLLGDGWYAGTIADPEYWEPKKRALLFCCMTLPDGIVISADDQWQCSSDGPLLYSDIYMGESCDLNRQWQNWHTPEIMEKQLDFEEFSGEPVRRIRFIEPVSVDKKIVDFGENLTGRVQLSFRAGKGEKVTVRYAEVLDENGELYTANLREAKSENIIIATGKTDVYEPLFTFHGFRYIEVTGAEHFEVKACSIHSDMPLHLKFNCSSELLNKLVANIRRGWLGNALDVPTDCPQRDERLGWIGDAQVFFKAALYLSDGSRFFRRWFKDVRLNCGERGWYGIAAPHHLRHKEWDIAGWTDGGIICPWELYRFTGDKDILVENYEHMLRFVTSRWERFQVGEMPDAFFGDWLNTNDETDKKLIESAYLCRSTQLMLEAAKVLGKTDDVLRLSEWLAAEKEYFIVNFSGRLCSQAGMVLALAFDLLAPEKRVETVKALVEKIRDRDMHLSTGFLGTPHLLHVLSDNGESETAWSLLEQTTFPSWLFPVLNGATTVWERWDGWTPEKGFQTPEMNSFNHYAYGAVLDWIIGKAAGISPDFDIDPVPGGSLSFLEAEYRGVFVRWDKTDDEVRYTIKVPAGVSASFRGKKLAGGKNYCFTEKINR